MKKITLYLLTIIASFLFLMNDVFAAASVSASASSSQVVVGNTVTYTFKVKSSQDSYSMKYKISYDSSKLTYVSGSGLSNDAIILSGQKTKTISVKFKAKSSGTATVKISGSICKNSCYSFSGSKSTKIITKAQLEASYSKDNNLKSLSIDGLKLSPSFSKGTTSYTVEASPNTTSINIKAKVNDSKAKVSGTGKKNVSEGDNKFNIVVTAQNGSTKTYTIVVKVTDPNPIEVTIGENTYTVVKRESSLPKVEDFTSKTTKLSEEFF